MIVPPLGDVDFIEFSEHSVDVEYGGRDLLHIYNVQQLYDRLSAKNLFICSDKVFNLVEHSLAALQGWQVL